MHHQSLVGDNIQTVSTYKMELAMTMEIKETILHKKGDEFYNMKIQKAPDMRVLRKERIQIQMRLESQQ